MAKLRQINLLTSTSFEHSTAGRIISWASNVGRWIVVLTEFIVITAFLSRFYFDTRLANLFDEIRQKKAIVNSSYAFEEQYRQAQNKLRLAGLIITKNSSSSTLIKTVSDQLPLDVTLMSLSVDVDTLNIEGYALSINGLKVFVDGLAGMRRISDVRVGKLSTRSDGFPGTSFSITAKVGSII